MPEPLKNIYNSEFFDKLSQRIRQTHPAFDDKRFLALIFDKEWENRELKSRMRHITQSLHDTLRLPFAEALEVLKPPASQMPYGFEYMFFPDYVEVYGLEEDWDYSHRGIGALHAIFQFGVCRQTLY